jgi:seryl-tRNA synthetase
MSILTLGQASKLVGKSKPTISKAVTDGKLSGKKVNGVFEIDKSELERVYGKTSVKAQKAKTDLKANGGSTVLALENKHLEEKVADLQNRLDKAEEREQSANTRLDSVLLQIADQRDDQARKSLWQRLVGK